MGRTMADPNRIHWIGEEHIVPYPFSRDTYEAMDEEGVGTVQTWRPGCTVDLDERGNASHAADRMGAMVLRVVSRFKPGRYPERTFYIRLWRDPDGRLFGKQGLRMTTSAAFKRMCRGYRHEFEMIDAADEKDDLT
jgi:hypothetical protein